MSLTPEHAARFARQILLVELGLEGQERISAASAAVAGDGRLEHEVAGRYAERAGFAALAPGAIDLDALAPSEIVRDASARAVLAGARAALAAMRVAVEPKYR
jgi:hypothetical protein